MGVRYPVHLNAHTHTKIIVDFGAKDKAPYLSLGQKREEPEPFAEALST